ncbi:MAG TPA: hypothetical protein VMV72_12230 [Verrucomicrobiae bacterium]|nr:hypothetical protein [Verrucomicrobiae bacterium]
MDGVDRGPAAPTLADNFALDDFFVRGHGLGDGAGQIKIAADTLGIRAVESKHGFDILDVDFVFDPIVPGRARGIVVLEFHR